jgi:hypothetical protein
MKVMKSDFFGSLTGRSLFLPSCLGVFDIRILKYDMQRISIDSADENFAS